MRVGASIDANVARMYEPFVNAARRANGTILSDQKRAAKAGADTVATEEKRKQAIIERTATMVGQFAKKQVATEKQTAVAQISEAKKVADQKEAFERRAYELTKQRAAQIVRDRKAAASQEETDRKARLREVLAEGRRMNAEHAKSAKAAGGGGNRSFIRDTARYAARRLLYSAAGYAVSLPGRLAAGFGVNPQDIGSLVQNFTSRESLATDISNSGYLPGSNGPNAQRVSGAAIMQQAKDVGQATATDPTKALEGLQKFVQITGDLEMGRKVLGDMAKLAQATGSNLEDVVTAAGELSAKLGDMPNKAEAINRIMRHLAGEGKLGAIEMRDFAKELASVAAVAPMFSGRIEDNIGKMAALMQEARQHGGAKSAAEAATSTRAFLQNFMTPARIKGFNALTHPGSSKDWTRDAQGKVRDPIELITEVFRAATDKKTGVLNTSTVAKAFGGVKAMKSVLGFASADLAASEGTDVGDKRLQEGIKAVAEEFERLHKATMTQAEVDEAFAAKMETAAARAQLFNLKVQDLVDKAIPSLQKGVEQLGPAVLAAIPAFLSITSVFMKGAAGLAFLLGIKSEPDDKSSAGQAATTDLRATFKSGGKISTEDFMHKQKLANEIGERIKFEEKNVAAEEVAIRGGHGGSSLREDAANDKTKLESDRRTLADLLSAIRDFAQPGRIQDVRVTNPDEIKSKAGSSGASNGGPVAPAASGGQAPAARSHPYAGGGSFG